MNELLRQMYEQKQTYYLTLINKLKQMKTKTKESTNK